MTESRGAKNRIVFIGRFTLPDRDAAAIHVRGIADSLKAAGFVVDLYDDQMGNSSAAEKAMGAFRRKVSKVGRVFDYLITAGSYLDSLKSIDWDKTAAVICYPGSATLVYRLTRLCHRHRVPLIVEVVEWFDPHQCVGGRFGLFHLESELRMRYLHVAARNLICISSFLGKYYEARGCSVLTLPPILGIDNIPVSESPAQSSSAGNQISLVYAGMPGRRELFSEIVGGVQAARRRGIDAEFRVTGVTEAAMRQLLLSSTGQEPSLEGVKCYGRLPKREDALAVVRSSDFSVLVRPKERFADACFPTKFVESLAMGVPVIANATTDIADYLRDGVEGYLLETPTAAAVENAIVRASKMTMAEREAMRQNALSRARECFDYRRYSEALAEFVLNARQC